MDMDWGLLAQLAAGAAGQYASESQRAQAGKLLQDALDRFGQLTPPELPQVSAEQLGPSEAGAVSGDPKMKALQLAALNRLSDIQNAGGLTLQDRAVLDKVQGDLARQESAGRSQIANQMAARGMLNSGNALAMQLQNQQGSADRAQQYGLNTAAQAQARYLDSILKQGTMAGAMRGQDFDERFQAAKARDAINQYNAASREKAKYYNAGLPQQTWNNQMQQAGAMAGRGDIVAGFQNSGADRTALFGANSGKTLRDVFKPDGTPEQKTTTYSQPPLVQASDEDEWNKFPGSY